MASDRTPGTSPVTITAAAAVRWSPGLAPHTRVKAAELMRLVGEIVRHPVYADVLSELADGRTGE